jgi:hypothetical protein
MLKTKKGPQVRPLCSRRFSVESDPDGFRLGFGSCFEGRFTFAGEPVGDGAGFVGFLFEQAIDDQRFTSATVTSA